MNSLLLRDLACASHLTDSSKEAGRRPDGQATRIVLCLGRAAYTGNYIINFPAHPALKVFCIKFDSDTMYCFSPMRIFSPVSSRFTPDCLCTDPGRLQVSASYLAFSGLPSGPAHPESFHVCTAIPPPPSPALGQPKPQPPHTSHTTPRVARTCASGSGVGSGAAGRADRGGRGPCTGGFPSRTPSGPRRVTTRVT